MLKAPLRCNSKVECSCDITNVVIAYYFLRLIQVFLVLVQKTGQSFLRTVREFLGRFFSKPLWEILVLIGGNLDFFGRYWELLVGF
jgi:hypothetical protein